MYGKHRTERRRFLQGVACLGVECPQFCGIGAALFERLQISLPPFGEGELLLAGQGFDGVFEAGCGGAIFCDGESDDFCRTVGADVGRAFSGVVHQKSLGHIGRDASVEGSVRAPEHVDEPGFPNGRGHWPGVRTAMSWQSAGRAGGRGDGHPPEDRQSPRARGGR